MCVFEGMEDRMGVVLIPPCFNPLMLFFEQGTHCCLWKIGYLKTSKIAL